LRTFILPPFRPALRCLLSVLLVLHLAPGRSFGADPPPDPEPPRDLGATLGMDPGALVSVPNLLILGTAGVAAAITWSEVDENHSALRKTLDNSNMDWLMDAGNVYGNGWFVGGVSVGSVAAGSLTGSEGLVHFGGDRGRSFVSSGLICLGVKVLVNRPRPSGGPYSFPSGHTTTAFSTVPIAWHHAGWLAGVGAGAIATLTGLGRLEESKHYTSDIIVGAALGLVVGRAVIAQRRKAEWLDHLAVTGDSVGLVWRF